MKKCVAIYDRWLHTLGGGEQVAFTMAEILRDMGYDVTILTHKSVDLDQAVEKMNVNLHDISIKYIPNLLDYQLSEYTEQYHIFINNSYMDYVPNRSKFGMLSVFFPTKINISIYEYFKRSHIVPSLRKLFIYPTEFEGFRYDENIKGVIHKWLGRRSAITLSKSVRSISLELFLKYFSISCLDEIQFRVNKKICDPYYREVDIYNNIVRYYFKFPKSDENTVIEILLPDSEYSKEIALTRIWIRNYRYIIYNFFKLFFPKWEMRLHGGPSVTRLSDIESYDRIVVNSKFTQSWVMKYWHLPSDVLYPPAAIESFSTTKKKKNIIIHVGRFFVGGHSKKQLEMARVFREMVNRGVKDWELHFVGGINDGDIHRKYLENIRDEVKGYPVIFHINAPFSELKDILSQAKIYWHATGLDEDAQTNPIKLEHFGITTVEAMASGCVPVVINLGGQPEIVIQNSGFVWDTREELIEKTTKLIHDPKLLARMSKNAISRSKYFGRERFKQELLALLPK